MESHGLHPGLELRVQRLAERIALLQRKMKNATGSEKIEEYGELQQLERRYAGLKRRLQALNREGPGFWQNIKAEFERVADDVTGTVGDFMIKLDTYPRGDKSS